MAGNSPPSRAWRYLENCSPLPPKNDYHLWQKSLWETTKMVLRLMAKDRTELTDLNKIGAYHQFAKKAGNPKEEFDKLGQVPPTWITRGDWPGMWCALFSAQNVGSVIVGLPIVRIDFSPNYFLYDPRGKQHQEMWETWQNKPENMAKRNSWSEQFNADGYGMDLRVSEKLTCANHSAFFEEHQFGAVIGYSDYVAAVIIDPKAISFIHEIARAGGPEADGMEIDDDIYEISDNGSMAGLDDAEWAEGVRNEDMDDGGVEAVSNTAAGRTKWLATAFAHHVGGRGG